jgi:predicted nucleic acid-binding protein
MRVFLDTNILLDVLLNRPQVLEASAAVIARCEELGAAMFISWHGLATAYYLLKRGRSEAEALLEVDKILAWAQVASVEDSAARRARHLGFNDFEDALQAVSAEGCGADVIVTRNAQDFANSAVLVLTPEAFLEHFANAQRS